MSIPYFLYRSRLANLAGKYVAQLARSRTINLDVLAEFIAQSGLTASSSEVRAILQRTCEIVQQQLVNGNTVKLDRLCTFRPSIAGTFAGMEAAFDPAINHVAVSVTADKKLRKNVRSLARVDRVHHPLGGPNLQDVRDIATGQCNQCLTPGQIGQLDGFRLSFDAADAEQGLWVVSVGGEAAAVGSFQKTTDRQAVFMIPAAIGSWSGPVWLELRRRNQPEGQLLRGRSRKLEITQTGNCLNDCRRELSADGRPLQTAGCLSDNGSLSF